MSKLTGLIQEGLIALLLHSKEHGSVVRGLVPIKSYDGIYRSLAQEAIQYWNRFKQPPGEHALDICDQLERDNPKQAELIRQLFESIQECQQNINAQYVIDKASEFIRSQNIRTGILKAVELLEDDKLDEAEATMRDSLSVVTNVFNPGLVFNNTTIEDLIANEAEVLPTGIDQLDRSKLGPAIGEMHLLIAPSNYGKSWWLLQLTKASMLIRKPVVYITLEMSEQKMAGRLVQSFHALTKRPERNLSHITFEENEAGQLCDMFRQDVAAEALSKVLIDTEFAERLETQHARLRNRTPLIIKQYPTGTLTLDQLDAYLDILEEQQRIKPELLVIDYPDLMAVPGNDYRIALGNIYKRLRGIASDRQLALAVVSQTNREAVGRSLITEKQVSEDYSKIATSDTVISFNQTSQEQQLGLARLHVIKARSEGKGATILISQDYSIGQFCISSIRMNSNYWKLLKEDIAIQEEYGQDRDKTKRRERL